MSRGVTLLLVVAALTGGLEGEAVGLAGAVRRVAVEEQDSAAEQGHESHSAGEPVSGGARGGVIEQLLGEVEVLVDGAEERGRVDAVVQRPVAVPKGLHVLQDIRCQRASVAPR